MRAVIRHLEGQRFGKLVAEELKIVRYREKWQCKCDCGATTYVEARNLIRNHTQSCGCLRAERTRARATTGGRFREPEYVAWRGMVNRSVGTHGREPYSVDPAWQDSYETFYNDLGPRPTRKHRLHRVVPELGFTRGNCIWRGPLVYPGDSGS